MAGVRLVDDVVVLERRQVRQLDGRGELADVVLVGRIAVPEPGPQERQGYAEALASGAQQVLREHGYERESRT